MVIVRSAIAELHEIPATLAAFRRVRGQFGAFPLPSRATILAAELLCSALTGRNVNIGAVGVVEVEARGMTTFLAVGSGAGRIPADVVVDWQTRVGEAFCTPHTVSCMALTTEATFYVPAHQSTVEFIRQAFPHFAIPGSPLGPNDLTTAIDEVRKMPSSPFGLTIDGAVLPAGYAKSIAPVKKLLAVAVAMRIRAFDLRALADAKKSLDKFCTWLERHPYGDRDSLAENIRALVDPFHDNPNRPISTIGQIQSVVTHAWNVADLSRYCAEPKLFTYLRTVLPPGAVVGQLAMWWDSTRPNRYGFPGSEKSPFASYMLPCSSCFARSAEIMAGIPVVRRHPASAEEPVWRTSAPARGLQRRNSMHWSWRAPQRPWP